MIITKKGKMRISTRLEKVRNGQEFVPHSNYAYLPTFAFLPPKKKWNLRLMRLTTSIATFLCFGSIEFLISSNLRSFQHFHFPAWPSILFDPHEILMNYFTTTDPLNLYFHCSSSGKNGFIYYLFLLIIYYTLSIQ